MEKEKAIIQNRAAKISNRRVPYNNSLNNNEKMKKVSNESERSKITWYEPISQCFGYDMRKSRREESEK